jgi:hypothetical protein
MNIYTQGEGFELKMLWRLCRKSPAARRVTKGKTGTKG